MAKVWFLWDKLPIFLMFILIMWSNFKDQFFLVIHLKERSHAKVCAIETYLDYRCTNLFLKFWCQGHFLTGKGLMFTGKITCLNNNFTWRINKLGYIGDATPPNATSNKWLELVIETRLLMDANTKVERKFIFGEFYRFSKPHKLFSGTFYFWRFFYGSCRFYELWRYNLKDRENLPIHFDYDRQCTYLILWGNVYLGDTS